MTTQEVNNRVPFLQYINTGILTLIFGFAIMIFTTVINLRSEQLTSSKEIIKLKTVQDINVSNVDKLSTRVNILETNYIETLKYWIDLNYIRKPQK